MYTRPATLDDLPAMKKVAVDSLRLNPLHISLYKGRFDCEAYALRIQSGNRGLIEDPNCQAYVAVTRRVGGDIIGFIGFEKIETEFGQGPPGALANEDTVFPPKTDMRCLETWKVETTKMKRWFLKERGPYYRAHMLWVSPKVHKTGVGSLLCRHLADCAKRDRLPVLVDTTPFYERFAFLNGHKITRLKIVNLDAEPPMLKLTLHFMAFEVDEEDVKQKRKTSVN